MSNDNQTPKESVDPSQEKKTYKPNGESPQDKKEDVSPLGEDIVPAFYVVYNTKEKNFGLIGAPGFLEDRVRAYGALKMAEMMLNDYYAKEDRTKQSFMTKVKNFDGSKAFRSFIRRK